MKGLWAGLLISGVLLSSFVCAMEGSSHSHPHSLQKIKKIPRRTINNKNAIPMLSTPAKLIDLSAFALAQQITPEKQLYEFCALQHNTYKKVVKKWPGNGDKIYMPITLWASLICINTFYNKPLSPLTTTMAEAAYFLNTLLIKELLFMGPYEYGGEKKNVILFSPHPQDRSHNPVFLTSYQKIPNALASIRFLADVTVDYPEMLLLIKDMQKYMKKLTTLVINCCSLPLYMAPLAPLTHLKTLTISHTKLTELPKEIGQLTALTFLDLSYNKLISLPSTIGNLEKLKKLNVTENQIIDLPITLKNLKRLAYFCPNNNPMIDFKMMKKCSCTPGEIKQIHDFLQEPFVSAISATFYSDDNHRTWTLDHYRYGVARAMGFKLKKDVAAKIARLEYYIIHEKLECPEECIYHFWRKKKRDH